MSQVELLDCRRLTGPNVIWDRPGAIIDIACEDDEAGMLIAALAQRLEPFLEKLGWEAEGIAARKCSGGFSLAISAPMDALYAATDMLEAAWAAQKERASSMDAALPTVSKSLAEESNPALLRLLVAAEQRGVPWLCDDSVVSLGFGTGAESWPVAQAPDPQAVDWSSLHGIPIGLITGTNGKTTCSRLVSNMAGADGRRPGLSSTDWIAVDGEILDRGDYAGPGGARAVLRDERVDLAVLETARGGLLRRGLAVDTASAALITNISEDHLGDFGSRNLEELLDIKWTVTRALGSEDPLVLNAEDPLLVARAGNVGARVCFFSPDPANPVLAAHFAGGGKVCSVRDDCLVRGESGRWTQLLPVSDVPITFDGAARHNVANALGAIGLAHALGITDEGIRRGLVGTRRDDNPGRCNLYAIGGISVLVDFAHNVQAMRALFHLARGLPARRRILCFGQAGDRPDSAIEDLAAGAWAIGLERVVISELAKYYRGREPGEVFGIMRRALKREGARDEQISHQPDEIASLNHAMEWAEAGDLVIMLALAESGKVRKWLREKESNGFD